MTTDVESLRAEVERLTRRNWELERDLDEWRCRARDWFHRAQLHHDLEHRLSTGKAMVIDLEALRRRPPV